jgi:hypothetical protein
MADPGFSMNCPSCGAPLVYVRTDADAHISRCPRHGAILPPPDGRVRQQPQMICHCAEGWICEEHPDQPWPHDDCAGPGTRCENTDCSWWKSTKPAALDTSDWTDVIRRNEVSSRRREH